MTSKPQLNFVDGWNSDHESWRCPADGPPCRLLETEPFSLLKKRRPWPTHLCIDVAERSLDRWAWNHASRIKMSVAHEWWMQHSFVHHTLPVGREAIREAAWHAPHWFAFSDREFDAIRKHGHRAVDLAVFDGDETAALILPLEVADTTIDLFFLVEWAECGLSEHGEAIVCHAPSAVKVRVVGRLDDAATFVARATEWWTVTMAGHKIRAVGRPRLDVDEAMDRIRSGLAAYRAEFGHTPKRDVFLRHIGMSERTWKRYMSRTQSNWRTLIEAS